MPRTLDRRIEQITGSPGEWFVDLKPGWAYADANSDNAQHCFGEDTKADIRRSMKLVQPCRCKQCLLAMEGAAMTPQQRRAWSRLADRATPPRLDFDKPFSEQTPEAKAALERLVRK